MKKHLDLVAKPKEELLGLIKAPVETRVSEAFRIAALLLLRWAPSAQEAIATAISLNFSLKKIYIAQKNKGRNSG